MGHGNELLHFIIYSLAQIVFGNIYFYEFSGCIASLNVTIEGENLCASSKFCLDYLWVYLTIYMLLVGVSMALNSNYFACVPSLCLHHSILTENQSYSKRFLTNIFLLFCPPAGGSTT
jgi:hypothetical protein